MAQYGPIDVSGILRAREQQAAIAQRNAMMEIQAEEQEKARRAARIRTLMVLGGAAAGGFAAPAGATLAGVQIGAAAGDLGAGVVTREPMNPYAAVQLASAGIDRYDQNQRQQRIQKTLDQPMETRTETEMVEGGFGVQVPGKSRQVPTREGLMTRAQSLMEAGAKEGDPGLYAEGLRLTASLLPGEGGGKGGSGKHAVILSPTEAATPKDKGGLGITTDKPIEVTVENGQAVSYKTLDVTEREGGTSALALERLQRRRASLDTDLGALPQDSAGRTLQQERTWKQLTQERKETDRKIGLETTRSEGGKGALFSLMDEWDRLQAEDVSKMSPKEKTSHDTRAGNVRAAITKELDRSKLIQTTDAQGNPIVTEVTPSAEPGKGPTVSAPVQIGTGKADIEIEEQNQGGVDYWVGFDKKDGTIKYRIPKGTPGETKEQALAKMRYAAETGDKLRNDWLTVTQTYDKRSQYFGDLSSAFRAPRNPISDRVMMISLGRMSEPTSAVMLGEQEAIQAAQSLLGKARDIWAIGLEGQQLTPDAAQQVYDTARGMFVREEAQLQSLKQDPQDPEKGFTPMAIRAGVNPDDVMVQRGMTPEEKVRALTSVQATPVEGPGESSTNPWGKTVTTDAERKKVPFGAYYKDGQGNIRRKLSE